MSNQHKQPHVTIVEATGQDAINKAIADAQASNKMLANIKQEFIDGAWHYSAVFTELPEEIKKLTEAPDNVTPINEGKAK